MRSGFGIAIPFPRASCLSSCQGQVRQEVSMCDQHPRRQCDQHTRRQLSPHRAPGVRMQALAGGWGAPRASCAPSGGSTRACASRRRT